MDGGRGKLGQKVMNVMNLGGRGSALFSHWKLRVMDGPILHFAQDLLVCIQIKLLQREKVKEFILPLHMFLSTKDKYSRVPNRQDNCNKQKQWAILTEMLL